MHLFLCVLMAIYKAEGCPLKLQWWRAGTDSDRELRDLSQRQPFDFPSCPLCLPMGAPWCCKQGQGEGHEQLEWGTSGGIPFSTDKDAHRVGELRGHTSQPNRNAGHFKFSNSHIYKFKKQMKLTLII